MRLPEPWTSKIGRVDGITLPEALRTLRQAAKAPIALIIDEAQHALTSEAGENVMAALKSTRDQLNAPGQINLMLIMSGSDRDKLLRLVNTNGAPFYGSQVHRMPELAQDFIAHISTLIETQRALENLRQHTPALVWKSARGEYAVDDAAMHRWY